MRSRFFASMLPNPLCHASRHACAPRPRDQALRARHDVELEPSDVEVRRDDLAPCWRETTRDGALYERSPRLGPSRLLKGRLRLRHAIPRFVSRSNCRKARGETEGELKDSCRRCGGSW